ncbi:MAG: serine hydrolase [Anaerolineales bacterium]
MRRRGSYLIWFSLLFLLAALVLTVFQLVQFSRVRTNFPQGLVIAGVPVGGLDRQQASERLLTMYTTPVELHYGEAVIHLEPGVVEFALDLESMLAVADLQRTEESFWVGFGDYLLGQSTVPEPVPLRATYSEERLRTYLEGEIRLRYDQPAISPRPAVGTVNFIPGIPGTALDVDGAVNLIEQALFSTTSRQVDLPLARTEPPRLSFDNVGVLLRQTLEVYEFDGLAGIYLLDLQTGQETHFAYQQGEILSVQPDIAFTGASLIKIPILVSIFRNIDLQTADAETIRWLEQMIELSGNDPADWVMQRVLDSSTGPLIVSDYMFELGLENTFMGGYFYPGAPLLRTYQTPGNTRLDVNTNPDPYNQTSVSDMGMLLADIYECAQHGGGTLIAVWGSAITQQECQTMITYLVKNRLPSLLTAGLPEGTQIAHKHGWVMSGNDTITTISDAGIIYTPGGNFVMVVSLYHPVQLLFDPMNELVAKLAESVFNYYNLPQQ